MHLEEFAEGNSFFHRLDPRVKFITIMPYIFVIAIMQGTKGPLLALIISLLIVAFTRISVKKLIGRLIVVNTFIFILWIFLPFSYPGDAVFHIGPLEATHEGFLYVLSITLKANAIVLATIAILGTSEVFSLAHALVHLKVPDKLVHLFFFFYRYISVLHEEYERLENAMAIRAFKAKTNMHTYRTYAYLVGMLIIRSYDRSQRIYKAMLCRGFKGKFRVMSHFELKRGDVVFGLLMTLITSVMGLLFIL
ncbi:MAG: cobalt ECF transporter T component CbiQ [Thermodesulfovibrionales bacterium]|nr:cobalt ECF transporter T component CbiQ [Thermodesulfovibrionales bacterium]